jgi:hypothetical protein
VSENRLAELREQMRSSGKGGHPQAAAPAPEHAGGGFDAAEILALDYSLKPYVNAAGTVPEPTPSRLNAFTRRVMLLGAAVAAPEEAPDPAPAGKAAEEMGIAAIDAADIERLLDQNEAAEKELRGAVADLCAGSPSPEQIEALPTRVFMRFFRWLMGELSPEV